MDALHKILTFLANPLTLGLAGLLVAFAFGHGEHGEHGEKSARPAWPLFLIAIAWLWIWSTPLMTRWIGLPLEEPYPPTAAESHPVSDAICLLGGGMGVWERESDSTVQSSTFNLQPKSCPEMWSSADRAWMAAKLWKAGKAKVITITGPGAYEATLPLLKDFGVHTNSIVYLESAKNTEEEAQVISLHFKNQNVTNSTVHLHLKPAPRILLVTSAWHMRRAEWLFKRAGLEVVPAACDYEGSARCAGKSICAMDFLPDAGALYLNTYLWKEHFAYWCYRLRDWF